MGRVFNAVRLANHRSHVRRIEAESATCGKAKRNPTGLALQNGPHISRVTLFALRAIKTLSICLFARWRRGFVSGSTGGAALAKCATLGSAETQFRHPSWRASFRCPALPPALAARARLAIISFSIRPCQVHGPSYRDWQTRPFHFRGFTDRAASTLIHWLALLIRLQPSCRA